MKRILLGLLFVAGTGIFSAQAQFLKEMRDRAIERSKDVIIGKTAEKAAEKTGDAMDRQIINAATKRLACIAFAFIFSLRVVYASKTDMRGIYETTICRCP